MVKQKNWFITESPVLIHGHPDLTCNEHLNTRSYHMYLVKWSFFVLSNQKKFQKADDISSKIMFDENIAICLSLTFRLSITIGLS